MSLSGHGLTPRLKPLSARKSAILSVLDVGTSKVVCVVAELKPADEVEALRSRTHVARILGIGHQRSMGLKGGVVVDLEAAESAIRQAVHAAERMAEENRDGITGKNVLPGPIEQAQMDMHAGAGPVVVGLGHERRFEPVYARRGLDGTLQQ